MDEGQRIERTITDTLGISDSMKVGMRSYFSSHFLRSARRLSRLAGEIEAKGADRSVVDQEQRAFVVGSIVASAAFLEAMINELFQDAFDGHNISEGYLATLPSETVARMKAYWEETKGWDSPLLKYERLLEFASRDSMPRGEAPYQSAQLVLALRNALMHYKPATNYTDDVSELEKNLGRRFPENALLKGANPWWPDRALGYGASEWAWKSAVEFANRFCERAGIEPNYRKLAADTD